MTEGKKTYRYVAALPGYGRGKKRNYTDVCSTATDPGPMANIRRAAAQMHDR